MSTQAEIEAFAEKPRVAVSACLMGESVRWDGGHKLDRYVRNELGEHFEFTHYCPEVAVGLGS